LTPSPDISVHDLVAENFSQGLSQMPVLLYLTSSAPDSESSAVNVKVTEVEEVYASPLLIIMEPTGGVVSLFAITLPIRDTSKKVATKNNVAYISFLFKRIPFAIS